MNFEKTISRMDTLNNLWVDIKVTDIKLLHKASLLGGKFKVYELYDSYYMSFLHEKGNVLINFYGLELTEEQYLFQIQAWGNSYFRIEPGTELVLADNLYFI